MKGQSLWAMIALSAALAIAAPTPPVQAAGTRDAARGAMVMAAKKRAEVRKSIVGGAWHRPGRPVVDPGFRPPLAGRYWIGREIRREIRRRYVGRVVAGIVLGTIIRVAVTGRPPGPPPAAELCWVWSDRALTRGYWYYCNRD